MFCTKCGSQVQDGADFCPSCGNKMASRQQQQPGAWQAPPQGGFAPPTPPPGGPYAPQPGQAGAPGAARQAGSVGELDFGRIFSYLFKDPDWVKKVLMLSLMLIIPIVGWLVIGGYIVEVVRNVAEGRELPLPELNFGEQLSEGFSYFLPMFCITLILVAAGFVFSFMGRIPVVAIIGGLMRFALNILFSLYMLCAFPLAIVRKEPWYVFKFGDSIGALTSNFVTVLLALLVSIPIQLIGMAGIIGLGIGVLFTMPMAGLMMSHLYGQLGIILKKSVG